MSWLTSLFGWPGRSARTDEDAPGRVSGHDNERETANERESDGARAIEALVVKVAEAIEGLQKMTRVQARQGVRLEEVERKIEGGFSDLRDLSQKAAHQNPAAIEWGDLLDAADALDEAERVAVAAGDASMADGLRVVGVRITRFLAERGVRREALVGAAPDPALVRVVGTMEVATVERGHVAQVVRAAVTEKGRLLREGEVLVARTLQPATPPSSVEKETP